MWKFIAWITFAIAIGWLAATGLWSVHLTQEIAYAWVGEPQTFFIPYVDTHLLVAPAVPFYAIIEHGDWLPLLSILLCAGGFFALWNLAKKVRSKAYPDEVKAEWGGGSNQ